jgi:hypothetical protein
MEFIKGDIVQAIDVTPSDSSIPIMVKLGDIYIVESGSIISVKLKGIDYRYCNDRFGLVKRCKQTMRVIKD